jgi:glycosyltransferase involved in cell wall biosynthesis
MKFDADCYGAVDLDTILPNYFASEIRGKKRVYDAHELFTEQKEIITRRFIYRIWLQVEKFAVPKFENGYTVNDFIAREFEKKYDVKYAVVRNLPNLRPLNVEKVKTETFIIYQGAVNEGRSFETLIPAMKEVNAPLEIFGHGNFFDKAKQLINDYKLQDKVKLKGAVEPEVLNTITPRAHLAVMLFEDTGLNQYQSLANRFFDYIMAGVPQICVNYPQYRVINDKFGVAYLINDTKTETIANALNLLLANSVVYEELRQNCLKAREELNWQAEEKVVTDFYRRIFIEEVSKATKIEVEIEKRL